MKQLLIVWIFLLSACSGARQNGHPEIREEILSSLAQGVGTLNPQASNKEHVVNIFNKNDHQWKLRQSGGDETRPLRVKGWAQYFRLMYNEFTWDVIVVPSPKGYGPWKIMVIPLDGGNPYQSMITLESDNPTVSPP